MNERDLLTRIVIAWDADQDEEFIEAVVEARHLLGFSLADDADVALMDVMGQHAEDEDDDARRETFE